MRKTFSFQETIYIQTIQVCIHLIAASRRHRLNDGHLMHADRRIRTYVCAHIGLRRHMDAYMCICTQAYGHRHASMTLRLTKIGLNCCTSHSNTSGLLSSHIRHSPCYRMHHQKCPTLQPTDSDKYSQPYELFPVGVFDLKGKLSTNNSPRGHGQHFGYYILLFGRRPTTIRRNC